ncbi:ankyrin repeat-containing protein At5g02620-like [Neltuma alba]|uniref:ankyrin repeat-containing protein At5g02620-like n=1 Tax=Neltuma alba TaxID=207710 RepID=UPI0010A33193|nr:ankyrin repeat-containing protein At5g02620-like [Prosopis alba]
MAGSVNEKGIIPLHILASKPPALQSTLTLDASASLSTPVVVVGPKQKRIQKTHVRKIMMGWEDIRKQKEKHVWCGHILEALWEHKSTAYVEGGGAPQRLLSVLYSSDEDDDQEEEFANPFNNDRLKSGDDIIIAIAADDTHNEREDNKQNVQLTQIDVPDHQSKQKGCEERENGGGDKREPELLIAAKNGVVEIVKIILRDKPGAIYQTNSQGRNVLHVAVEFRQPHIFEILRKEKSWDVLIHSGDFDGNNTLHIVAKSKLQIQGSSALEMQDEIKWYEHVKSLLPSYLTVLTNQEGETPEETFLREHKDLVQKSDEWLSPTSESCSVVAALVAGVAYATSSTVPGGNDDKTGKPTLEGRPGFDIFAISALIALSFSVTALIMFLSILTSRKRPADFMKKLPVKLLLALSSLFVSIFSMFISFCAAHSFVLEDKSKTSVLPLYAIICLPVSFTIAEFPLYMDLFKGIFMKVQQPYDQRRI